ncbi:MAG: C40 family peptidase [Flavobacterium sp.]
MLSKKIVFCLLSLFLANNFIGHSQIITSKKEAVKQGIYQKPAEIKKPETETAKTVKITETAAKPKEPIAIKITKPAVTKPKKTIVINENEDDDIVLSSTENYLAMQMINNAMSFVGVKYRGGGTTIAGMDCSGMVTAIFNIFDIKLPRSSIDMSKVGERINIKDAQKGDLIFFKTRGRNVINHVGMVVEVLNDEVKFIHASSGNGVIVSSTKEAYYKKAFAQINKVLK